MSYSNRRQEGLSSSSSKYNENPAVRKPVAYDGLANLPTLLTRSEKYGLYYIP